ncbi:MAG: flippase-like domain-containing protein [Acidobacteria bacterium]|nr:flippase-like domain-containing protein [Acidobacteriota bacterium]
MTNPTRTRAASAHFAPAGAIAAVLGLLLFAWSVRRAGVAEILEGIRRVGHGFAVILLLASMRQAIRALAWKVCIEPPHRLPFRHALAAVMTGDAIGNLLPVGPFASEPTKAVFVRGRVPLMAALSSVTVENLLYTFSVAVVIIAGTVAFLSGFPLLPPALRVAGVAAIASMLMLIGGAALVFRRKVRVVSGGVAWVSRRGVAQRLLEAQLERLRTFEERVYGFYARNQRLIGPVVLLDALFHVLAIAEVYVTLALISSGPGPGLLTAFVLETVNRVITIVFKFVPLRLGVDEAGTGLMTSALQLGSAAGVTLAIVRKARVLFWTTIGVVLLVRRGFSVDAVLRQARGAADS